MNMVANDKKSISVLGLLIKTGERIVAHINIFIVILKKYLKKIWRFMT